MIKKEKLEQEYKAYQNEILENKVKQEIKKLEEYDAINSSDIIEGNKYSFNSPKTIKTETEESDKINENKNLDKADNIFEFAPIVEELNHPYIEPTPIKNINEIVIEEKIHSILSKIQKLKSIMKKQMIKKLNFKKQF